MAATKDTQVEREANAFRPDRRPFLFGLLGNLMLAFVFIVLPYTRARVRASEARHAFAQFAACFLDAKAVDDPGLAFPSGEREHYAQLVMHSNADWPARCDASLHEIAPSQATFLFPSVKQADADTRAAIDLFRNESKVLRTQRDKLDHVPGRPLLALSRLRGSLAMLLDAAGDPESIDRDAITFASASTAITATRVPLSAASGATLHMHSDGAVFSAHALDQRGLSWVRVQDGKVDRHRPKRSRLLRALAFAPEPLLLWSLTAARCAGLENGCVHRAMGAALLGEVGAELPHPQWLTAHPPGRPDRHVRLVNDRLWVVALDEGPAKREVRVFTLKPQTGDDADPVGASHLWPLGSLPIADSLLIATTPPQLLTASVEAAQTKLTLHSFEPQATRTPLTTLTGTTPALLQCLAGDTLWLAAITEASTLLVRKVGDAAHTSVTLDQHASWPFHTEDPARDRVTLLCDGERAVLLSLDESAQTLVAHACSNELECSAAHVVGDKVRAFSALLRGPDLIVASAANPDNAQVYVQRFDGVLSAMGPRVAPAPCWSPVEGFCGQPTLTQDPARLLLGAREQSDLLVIESRDDGATWRAMTGLKVDHSLAPDGTIMNIHRDRKRYTH